MLEFFRVLQALAQPIDVSVTGHASTSTNYITSSRTFSSVALGEDHADRLTVVAYCGAQQSTNNQYPTAVTVGGRSATLVGYRQYGSNSRYFTSLWIVDSSGLGTSADVFVQSYRNADHHAICAVRMITRGPITKDAFAGAYDANPLSTSVTVPNRGALVAVAGAGTAFSWTGATEAQRFGPSSGYSLALATTGTSQSVNVTGTVRGMSVAAWAPK